MKTVTVYRINIEGTLSDKEHLNNDAELNNWLADKYGKFATVILVQDESQKSIILTDNGVYYERTGPAKLFDWPC